MPFLQLPKLSPELVVPSQISSILTYMQTFHPLLELRELAVSGFSMTSDAARLIRKSCRAQTGWINQTATFSLTRAFLLDESLCWTLDTDGRKYTKLLTKYTKSTQMI
jgi:hypothetical protein